MKTHRYYLGDTDLTHDFWMDDERLFHQWSKVLRYAVGREVILFNAAREERLYRIIKFGNNAVHVELVTELVAKLPRREVYLCFSLLKKDKNEWILQKATELGVSHFVPLITDRTEKTGWDAERAEKIVIEAAEQCERTDIPRIREPMRIETIIDELQGSVQLLVAEQGHDSPSTDNKNVCVFVGPEGGWSADEKQLFQERSISHIGLGDFTLRAETATIAAATLLQ